MPAQYAAERSALIKILLHATAHPSQAVNGLLLGKIAADAASGGSVEIVDALPLFHTYLSLAPMTEVALLQARDNLQQYLSSVDRLMTHSTIQALSSCRLMLTLVHKSCK